MKFRTRAFEIEAVCWNGNNFEKVFKFTNGKFRRAALVNNSVAEVYDYLHDTWVNVYVGQWVIKGMKNEFYPCDPEVFEMKYEEI